MMMMTKQRNGKMVLRAGGIGLVAIGLLLTFPGFVAPVTLDGGGFAAGDVFISLHTGQIQWRHADGTLVGTLANTVPGKAEGMAFDAALNLFVTHHCADNFCLGGNAVERFSPAGVSMGVFGSGYNCNPNSLLFDADGYAFVGQADCSGDVLKLSGTGVPSGSYDASVEARGTSWIDLAADGCTLYYTSASPKVKRYNVCADTQLSDFALLGDIAYDVKVLPDGGVLVADNSAIVRLNSAGAVIQTYDVIGEPDLWLGLGLAGDGSFWVSNYGSSNVFKIDLGTGNVQTSFNTGTPSFTVKDVEVTRAPASVTARGRMTGGGSVFTTSGMRVTHGFELHCDVSRNPNNLEVNWQGNKFHLEELTLAECTDDPTINPTPPPAPFDTYHGTGNGRYNGQAGATAEWTFTDAGEPGTGDRATITVKDSSGNTVLTVSGFLRYGNHQAHK